MSLLTIDTVDTGICTPSVGTTTETHLQEEILQESRDHEDIVQVQEMSSSLHHCLHASFQGNFLDTYRNLTYKSVMGHLWVT